MTAPTQDRLFQRPLTAAVAVAHAVIDAAVAEHQPEAVCLLYSGGKDSSVVLDVCADRADYIVHIDTGVGLKATRDFVEAECTRRDLDLIVETGESFRDMVLKHGFPGPAAHLYAYTLLKERALRKVRRRFVQKRGQRIMYLSGVRRDESARRMVNGQQGHVMRDGSTVWVAPLLDWQNDEMAAYRRDHDVRISPVYEHIHISGECLCGAFGSPEELNELEWFYPNDPTIRMLRDLEAEAEAAGVRPCQWGPGRTEDFRNRTSGLLCNSCELRLPGMDT